MNATVVEPASLTPDQAVREILRLEQNATPLLHRTIGLTWMIWAVVSGAIFVSYEAIGLAAPTGALAVGEFGLAWLPWVLLGSLATTVLWRSLALVMPETSAKGVGVSLVAGTTFLAIVLGGLGVIALAHLSVNGPTWAMIGIGIATAVVGGSGFTTDARSERVVWLLGGVGLVALSIGIGVVAGWTGYDPIRLLLVLGPVASSGLLFAGGLYTASE
jgi:hypothetical protein